MGNGDGGFAPSIDVAAPVGGTPPCQSGPGKASLAATDLDGDRRIDLILAGEVAAKVGVLRIACR